MRWRYVHVCSIGSGHLSIQFYQAALGKISFTSDLWSDKNLRSYLCLTAHWMARNKRTRVLELRCVLVAFHNVTGHHDGVNLARTMLALLDRAGVTAQVCLVMCYEYN